MGRVSVITDQILEVGGHPVSAIREDFPVLKRAFPGRAGKHESPLVYLDNAATAQKPRAVLDAMDAFYEHRNANVHRALYALAEEATEAYEESRQKVKDFIHARSTAEIIFTRGATEAINLVAASWGRKFLQQGDEILLTEMEHHSNLIPWQLLAQERGLRLRFIPFAGDGALQLDQLPVLWNDRIKMASIVHMSNVLGTINDVRRLIGFCHDRGVPVLIDSAQGVPHLPVDVQALDCDFLAFSGHKMCGPTGIGILYGKERWLEQMPPYMGGGEMIQSVWLDRATWNDLPYKFEAGTPNIAGAIGLGAAADYLSGLKMENIQHYENALTKYAMHSIRGVPDLTLYGPALHRGGVLAFNLRDIHAHDVAQFLDREGIAVRAGHHCAQPVMRKLGVPATARASLSFYNTTEDIDRMVQALKAAREFFTHGF